jgi:hypothetical protein
MNFTKGLSNLFKPTYINFILALCLIIILILIYLKTNNLDLFTEPNGYTTKPILATLLKGNDYLTSFINNYTNKILQQNTYKQVLATQEQTIQSLSQKVSKLINPST